MIKLNYFLDLDYDLQQAVREFTKDWTNALLLTVRELSRNPNLTEVKSYSEEMDNDTPVMRFRCLDSKERVHTYTFPQDKVESIFERLTSTLPTHTDSVPVVCFLPEAVWGVYE